MRKPEYCITYERLQKIRKEFKNNKRGIWLRKLAKETSIPITCVSRYLKTYFKKKVKYQKIGKITLMFLQDFSVSQKELLLKKKIRTFEAAVKLRESGKSYSEISEIIRKDLKFNYSSGWLSQLLKDVVMSEGGKKRYLDKVSRDRARAGSIGGKLSAESGHLDKIRPLAWKRYIEMIDSRIPPSSKKLTVAKVKIIAHCLFDGSVTRTKRYNAISYMNKTAELIEEFKRDMKFVYNLEPTDLTKRESGYMIRYCCKAAVDDLLQYTEYGGVSMRVPKEIMNGPLKWKKEFLKCFWDDEGAVRFSEYIDKKGRKHTSKYVEAYCKEKFLRDDLRKLHENLSFKIKTYGKKIRIDGQQNMRLFVSTINFSPTIKLSYPKSKWNGKYKKDILELLLKSYKRDLKSIYIESYGCSANAANAEIMAGLLKNANYKITNEPEDADLIIINTCFVKSQTELKMRRRIEKLPNIYPTKRLVISGCFPEGRADDIRKISPRCSLVGPHHVTKIIECVDNAFLDNYVEYIGHRKECKANLPHLRKNKLISIVEIADGCLSNCSYCCTKQAKGHLYSYPIEKILKEIKSAEKYGDCKEVWITAQDTSAYGQDIGTNLAELLQEVAAIDGDFKARVGMMNPVHVLPIIDDLIAAFKSDKIFKFLHIPVQSGNDEVLKNMNRQYTIQEFKGIVEKFRKEIPKLTISTDIIVGFPGETEEQFQDSVQLVRDLKFDVVNISRFGSRPGTPAERMPQLSENVKKERSRLLSEVVEEAAFERNRGWLNWSGEVLIDEIGKPGSFIGRNFAYKPVVVKSEDGLLGKKLHINIIRAEKTYLLGEV